MYYCYKALLNFRSCAQMLKFNNKNTSHLPLVAEMCDPAKYYSNLVFNFTLAKIKFTKHSLVEQ